MSEARGPAYRDARALHRGQVVTYDIACEWARLVHADISQGKRIGELLVEIQELKDANLAIERELERHRHGNTIEGDFVCPDSLTAANVKAELRDASRDCNHRVCVCAGLQPILERIP